MQEKGPQKVTGYGYGTQYNIGQVCLLWFTMNKRLLTKQN